MPGVLVALGGNALLQAGDRGTWPEARARFRAVVPALVELAAREPELVLTHGNGPQVGVLLRQNELAQGELPVLPLDALGAESQGQIGYLIQEELTPGLRARGIDRTVLTVISRTEVDPGDPAFRHPTKPVGRFYSAAEAEGFRARLGWTLAPDPAGRGWRRVVPSPRPVRWLEGRAVRALLDGRGGPGWIPVVSGGGGVPVVPMPDGSHAGVEAVIDKDLAAAMVARTLGLDTLAIVTDVPGAALGFGTASVRWLGETSPRELRGHLAAGAFAPGSMRPKVEAALEFLDHGGRQALITDVASLADALDGRAGTRLRGPAR